MQIRDLLRPTSLDEGDLSAKWSLRRRLHDYANVGRQLLAQRIVIYSSAILLAGAYFNAYIAAAFYVAVWLCELYDGYVFRKILRQRTWSEAELRTAMTQIYLGTFASSATIAMFCITLATFQGVGSGHFLSLFLLVSASIFAAMNNNQFLPVLTLRLSIYILAVLYIPIRDLLLARPPLSSDIWLNFFTVLFVLGFLMELARSFLAAYSRNLKSRRELEQEHELTKAAFAAKTRFLATVSHELRTPLTSIKGTLVMINSGAMGQPPEKMKRPLEIATRNSERLSDLVGDLLFLQSTDVGKIELDLRPIDIVDSIKNVVEQFQPYADRLNVQISNDTEVDEAWVQADKKRLEQVLLNLLSNGAKFSHAEGTVFVSLEVSEGTVKLSVRDEGIGIPEGSTEQVFEAFCQLDSNDNRKYDGTGVGLSIAKRIVEAHKGKISYISKEGSGTTFTVELLRAESASIPSINSTAA